MANRPREPVKSRDNKYHSRFLKNTLKSLGFITKDAISSIAPNLTSTVTTGANVSRQLYESFARNKAPLERVNAVLTNNKYVKVGNEIVKNALSDVVSGKFWNEDRDSGEGDFGGSSYSFGDDDTGEESPQMKEEISATREISASLDNVGQQLQKNAIAQIKVTKAATDAILAAHSANMFQSQQFNTEALAHLTNIENNLAAIVKYQNENMSEYIKQSIGFYEKVGASYSKNAENKNEKVTASDVIGNGLDFGAYKEIIKAQFKDTTIGTFMDSQFDLIINQMRKNPIGTVISMFTQQLIPKALGDAIKGAEQIYTNSMTRALLELGEYGNNLQNDTSFGGIIKRTLAQTFGLRPEKRVRDLRSKNVKIERGPIPFDGETKHAIVEIITNELRTQTAYMKIISEHLTNKNTQELDKLADARKVYWDYNTNTYMTGRDSVDASIAKKLSDSVINEFQKSNLGRLMTSLVDQQTKLDQNGKTIADKEKQDELNRVLNEFYVKIGRNSHIKDIETLRNILDNVGGTESARNTVRDFLNQINADNPDAVFSTNVATINSRKARSRAMEELISNPSQWNLTSSRFNAEDIVDDKFDELMDAILFKGGKTSGGSTFNTSNLSTSNEDNRTYRLEDILGNQFQNRFGNTINELRNGHLLGAANQSLGFIGDRLKTNLIGIKNEQGKREGGIFSDLINGGKEFVFGGGINEAGQKVRGIFDQITDTLRAGIVGWQESFFGKKEDETDEEFRERVSKEVAGQIPRVEKGLIGGAIVGGILGQPLLGAAVGAATGFISRSDFFQDFLFGKEDENGERSIGGVINKRIRDFFKDKKDELFKATAGGAIGGGVLGMFVGGPIAGALLGAASGILSKTGMFGRFLYGDETTGQRGFIKTVVGAFNRITKDNTDEDTRKTLGKGILGAAAGYLTASMVGQMGLLGAALTPFGPIGGAIAGLALTIKAQEGNLKSFLFGDSEEEINGKKFKGKAGVFGELAAKVKVDFLNPLLTEATTGIHSLFNRIEHHILSPIRYLTTFTAKKIGSGLNFIGKTIINMATAPFRFMGNILGLGSNLGGPLGALVRLGSSLGGAMLSAPGRAVKNLIGLLDPSMRTEMEMDERAFQDRQKLIKESRLIKKRHDKNASKIRQLTRGRYSEDTEEARDYIRETNPKAYEEYFGEKSTWNGGANKNTSLTQEAAARVAARQGMTTEALLSGKPETMTFEQQQAYYAAKTSSVLEKIFGIELEIKENQEEDNDENLEDKIQDIEDDYEASQKGNWFQRLGGKISRRFRHRHLLNNFDPYGVADNNIVKSALGYSGEILGSAKDIALATSGAALGAVGTGVKYAAKGIGKGIGAGVSLATKSYLNEKPDGGHGTGGRGPEEDKIKNPLKEIVYAIQEQTGVLSKFIDSLHGQGLPVDLKAITAPDKDIDNVADKIVDAEKETNAELIDGSTKNTYDTDGKTVEEIREEREKEEEREERKSFYLFVKEKLSGIHTTEEEKKLDWRSIFSKKGLITLGLLSVLPFLTKNIPTLIKNVKGILGAIGGIIKKIADALGLGDGSSNSSTTGIGLSKRENGDSITDRIDKIPDTLNPFRLYDENYEIDHMTEPKLALLSAIGSKTKILPKFIQALIGKTENGVVKEGLLPKTLNFAGNAFSKTGEVLSKLPELPAKLGQWKLGVDDMVTDIKNIPKNIGNNINGIKTDLIGGLRNGFDSLLNNRINIGSPEFIADNFDNIYNKLVADGMDPNTALAKLNELQVTGEGSLNTGRNILGKGVDKLRSGFGRVQTAISNKLNPLKTSATSMIDDVGRAVSTKMTQFTDDAARMGSAAVRAVKNTRTVTRLTESFTKSNGLGRKVIEICRSAFTWVIQRASSVLRLSKSSAKFLGNTVLKGGGILGKFFEHIGRFISKIAGKISAVLSSKTVGAVVSFGLSEAGFITLGALNGITGAAKLFHVKVDEKKGMPDGTMRVISSVMGGLAQTIPGAVIQICAELFADITGVDILSEFATLIYNKIMEASGDEDKIKLLEEQKKVLSDEYENYQKEELTKQYEAQKAAGIIDPNETIEQFTKKVQSGERKIAYDSEMDYNAKENASFAGKIVKNLGTSFKKFKNESKIGTWLFGKKTEQYRDEKTGNLYRKNDETGKFDVYDKDGKKITEGIAKETLETMEGLKEETVRVKSGFISLLQGIGKTLSEVWKRLEPVGKTLFEGAGSVISGMVDIFGYAASGDVNGLFKYNPGKHISEDQPFGGLLHTVLFGAKMASFPAAFVSATFQKVGSFVGKIAGKAASAISTVANTADKLARLAEEGDFLGIWREKINVKNTADDPVNLIGNAVVGLSKVFYSGVAIFGKVFKPIIETIGKVVDWVGEKVGNTGIGKFFRTLWGGEEALEKQAEKKGIIARVGDGLYKVTNMIFNPGKNKTGGSGTGNDTYYSQKDSRWANMSYGYDGATMGEDGCGPTVAAMALSNQGLKTNPLEMANLAQMTGDRDSTGTNSRFFDKLGSITGVPVNPVGNSASVIGDLMRGKSVVALGRTGGYGKGSKRRRGFGGRGEFESGGHYIELTGYDPRTGKVKVSNPSGKGKSGWVDASTVMPEIGRAWSIGGRGPIDPYGADYGYGSMYDGAYAQTAAYPANMELMGTDPFSQDAYGQLSAMQQNIDSQNAYKKDFINPNSQTLPEALQSMASNKFENDSYGQLSAAQQGIDAQNAYKKDYVNPNSRTLIDILTPRMSNKFEGDSYGQLSAAQQSIDSQNAYKKDFVNPNSKSLIDLIIPKMSNKFEYDEYTKGTIVGQAKTAEQKAAASKMINSNPAGIVYKKSGDIDKGPYHGYDSVSIANKSGNSSELDKLKEYKSKLVYKKSGETTSTPYHGYDPVSVSKTKKTTTKGSKVEELGAAKHDALPKNEIKHLEKIVKRMKKAKEFTNFEIKKMEKIIDKAYNGPDFTHANLKTLNDIKEKMEKSPSFNRTDVKHIENVIDILTDDKNAVKDKKENHKESDTGLTTTEGVSGSGGKWLDMVAAAKAAISALGVGYSENKYVDVTVNGQSYRTRTDCSGFVSLCLQVAGVYSPNSVTSSVSFGSKNDTLSAAGFTPLNFSGWDNLQPGDIIAQPGRHVEIFSRNEGDTHYVYNYGSNKSAAAPGETTDSGSGHNYSHVWRPGADLVSGSWSGSESAEANANAETANGEGKSGSGEKKKLSLFEGISAFVGEFINRLISGDWTNTDYSNVFNPSDEESEFGTYTSGTNSKGESSGSASASEESSGSNVSGGTSDVNLRKIGNIEEAYAVLDSLKLSPKKHNFIKSILPGTLQAKTDYGVRPSITLAQGALESSWGESGLATKYNNLFGMKAGSSWKGKTASMGTQEFRNGKYQKEMASWRVYDSKDESVIDHGKLLTRPVYKDIIAAQTYDQAIDALHKSPYATDPQYGSKIRSTVNANKLYSWDNFDPKYEGENKNESESKEVKKATGSAGDFHKLDNAAMEKTGGKGTGRHSQPSYATISNNYDIGGHGEGDATTPAGNDINSVINGTNPINALTHSINAAISRSNSNINDTNTIGGYNVKRFEKSKMTDSERFDKMIEILSQIASSNTSADTKLDALKLLENVGSNNGGNYFINTNNGYKPIDMNTGKSIDGSDQRRSQQNFSIASKIATGGIS